MLNNDKKIFCVIPAFNEEKEIGSVIDGVKQYIENVVVVDDESSDKTVDIAKQHGAIVLKHLVNRGQGAALQTGDEYALKNGANIIVHFDADGQFISEEIPSIIEPLYKEECDIVFGSRFLNKNLNMPYVKKNFIYPIAKFITRFFLKINISDPQCGFRALSRHAANLITIENDRMAHCSEILMKTQKNKIKYQEIPITVVYKRYGQNFFGGINILKDLFLGKFTQ